MKKILIIVIGLGVAIYNFIQEAPNDADKNNSSHTLQAKQTQSTTTTGNKKLIDAYKNAQSDVQVKGLGKVVKILSDDTKGSKHQRFILRVSANLTILIAHNIDLAPRINSLTNGDTVEFFGEYEYNTRGGVVHWTHKDHRGNHIGGWLKHNGKSYQ